MTDEEFKKLAGMAQNRRPCQWCGGYGCIQCNSQHAHDSGSIIYVPPAPNIADKLDRIITLLEKLTEQTK